MASILDDVEVRGRYLGLLRVGTPKRTAAVQSGLTHRQVQGYASKNPDFAAEIADAVGEGVDPLYSKAYELALGVPCTCGGGHTEVSVGKQGNAGQAVQVHDLSCRFMPPDPDMLKFMLKSLDGETFGSKVSIEVEHRVSLGNAAELLELEDRLRRRAGELAGGQAVLRLEPGAVRELPA